MVSCANCRGHLVCYLLPCLPLGNQKFNIKTPGREEVIEDDVERSAEEMTHGKKGRYDAARILAALGGKENIADLDNCVTRLRLVVNDMSLVNDAELKACGALGVMKLDATTLQVVIGSQVATVKNEIERIMEGDHNE